MNTLIKAHAFNLGYEVSAIVTSGTRNQTQVLEAIRARLDFLDAPIEFSQSTFNEPWIDLQIFFQKVLGRLQVRHGDVVASHFILPVNVLVAIFNPPIQDFAVIEAALYNIDLPPVLVREFQSVSHNYNVGTCDGRDPQPLVDWVKKIHEHFYQVASKGSCENPHDNATFSVKEWFMGDKIEIKAGNISGGDGQIFIGKFNDVIVSLNNTGQKEFADALTKFKEAIMTSEHIAEETKQEHIEVINKIGEEAAKEKPNKTLIKAMSEGLFSILKSVPDLVKAIAAVAPFFSHLP